MNTTRNQKRVIERQLKKAYKMRIIVPAHLSFDKIKSELIDCGWFYEEEFDNVVEYYGDWRITTSPALKLHNEVFSVTLIPHNNDGIEISRLEVHEHFRGRGYAGNFLKCILQFLLQHEIDDIFLIPLPALLPEGFGSDVLDIPQLQRFYSKRGFRKLPKNKYWKLDKSIFLSYTQGKSVDFELLKTSYIPIGSDFFIGQSFDRKFRSMPIKMKIYNRA